MMNQKTEIQQLTQSVAALTQSLEHSQQHTRRTQRMLFAVFLLLLITVLGVMTNSGPIRDAYAADQVAPSQQQILQKMMPALEAMGTLMIRMKQDSDLVRAKALMRTLPNKYPPGSTIDQFSQEDLNSANASSALMVGSIAQEVRFVHDSLNRMNYSIEVMSYHMDRTMGPFGDIMP